VSQVLTGILPAEAEANYEEFKKKVGSPPQQPSISPEHLADLEKVRLQLAYREALRQLAKTPQGLAAFGEFVFGMIPAAHHKIWLRFLETNDIHHLILVGPPGHAKSTWVSVIYPAWRIGQNPDIHFLGTSVTATQSQLFSVAIRDTISSNPRYKEVFEDSGPDRKKGWGQDEWFVKRENSGDPHSTFAASGVGGPIIGRRADEIGLDDPYDEKNSATELQREKVLTWLKRTLRSRLAPNGNFKSVLTRWHNDDFVAEFENQGRYTIVRMKALTDDSKEVFADVVWSKHDMEIPPELFPDRHRWINKDERTGRIFIHDRGPALWPEFWTQPDLEEERETIGLPLFNCMYQGDPSALSGDMFSIDSFKPLPRDVKLTKVKQFWDLAVTEKETANFSACCTAGIDADGNFYILRMRRSRMNAKQIKEAIIEAYYDDVQEWILLSEVGVEEGLLSITLIKELEEDTEVPITGVIPKGDKVARARPVEARGQYGRLFVDKTASWWTDFLTEFLAFAQGKYDDQVDAVSGVYELLRPRKWKKIDFLKI